MTYLLVPLVFLSIPAYGYTPGAVQIRTMRMELHQLYCEEYWSQYDHAFYIGYERSIRCRMRREV